MALKQLEAPKIEPVSLDEAKLYLKIDQNEEDDLLASMITAARRTIETYCGRCLISQSWRFQVNAGFVFVRSDYAYLQSDQSMAAGGVELPKGPFIELVGTPVLLSGEKTFNIREFRLDTLGPFAKIHLGGGLGPTRDTLQVDFKAGYGDKAEDVPAEFKQAILMIVGDLYRNRHASETNSIQEPLLNNTVRSLIEPYRLIRLG